jgi:hypothetical protein
MERDWAAYEQCVNDEGIYLPEVAKIALAALTECKRLEAENRDLITIIDDLTDGHPCQYDYYNFCRTHEKYRPCPEERAAAVLDAQLKRVEAERGKD